MEIQINSRNVAIDAQQEKSIVEQLEFTFGRFRSQIRLVRVSLTDVDGPRAGTDVLCRFKVVLQNGEEILVGDTELTVEKAVANVSARAARSVARHIDLRRPDATTRTEIVTTTTPLGPPSHDSH